MRKIIAPLVVLTLGIGLGAFLILSKPQPELVPPEKKITKVITEKFSPGNFPAVYTNTGIVKSSQRVNLTSVISGTVTFVAKNFLPGNIVKQGEVLIKLSSSTLEERLKISEANLKQAQANYELELGKQRVAKENVDVVLKATGAKPNNQSLMLRQPQLEQAKANLLIAERQVALAKSDLEDTIITAPFNAMILSKNISISSNVVGKSTVLGDLVDTDQYWIEVLVPDSVVPWLTPKNSQIMADVYPNDSDSKMSGYVLKTIKALDEASRMARVVVAVDDPLHLNQMNAWQTDNDLTEHPIQLMLNDYIKVKIIGRTMPDVIKMPIDYLHSGNTVWVMANNELLIKDVKIVYKDTDYVYIKSGLLATDEVITTNIGVPVANMHLELITQGES